MQLIPTPYPSFKIEEITRVYPVDETGPEIHSHEVKMDNTRMMWFNFTASREYRMPMRLHEERVELHFTLHGRSGVTYEDQHLVMYGNQQSIFYQHDLEGEYILYPGEKSAFFEIEMPRPVFESLVTEDCPFLQQFSHKLQTPRHYLWPGYSMAITPQMHMVIAEMSHTKYSGQMKRLFLEAKTVELFLLQVNGYDQHPSGVAPVFRPSETESLHAAKQYLEQHFAEDCSILTLAMRVGMNQKKLKQGFRVLFGHTVFGYLSHVRMEKAKQLLLDEQKTIGEVSELVGYKHQQHFTTAFRKKYGTLPKYLKH
jgi:AraC-like DNA-binding protein